MELIPLKTGILKPGDDLAGVISDKWKVESGDIVVLSSKAVATCEGAIIDLREIEVSEEAKGWGGRVEGRNFALRCASTGANLRHSESWFDSAHHDTAYDFAFRQTVLDECRRWNGRVLSECPNAMLTELKPTGMTQGVLLVPNAGLDRSNVGEGKAIGWPRDPVGSVRRLRRELEIRMKNLKSQISNLQPSPSLRPAVAQSAMAGRQDCGRQAKLRPAGKKIPISKSQIPSIAVVLSDSCCRPGRIGVTAFALAASGMDPVMSQIGQSDLFGIPLAMTQEAVADQLATAANLLMGNAGQGIPAVIIRDHGLELTDFEGWVPGIEPSEDLFRGMQG